MKRSDYVLFASFYQLDIETRNMTLSAQWKQKKKVLKLKDLTTMHPKSQDETFLAEKPTSTILWL